MPLATRQNVKDYFRIETTAEDTLLDDLLSRAKAKIEQLIGMSITTEAVTWYDEAKTLRMGESVRNLILRNAPLDAASVVVKDRDGTTVPAADYTLRPDVGLIVGKLGVEFAFGPYTIAANAGLQHSANYATRVEPHLNSCIIDLVGFYYQQRTVGASSTSAAGTSVSYVMGIDYGGIDAHTGLPKRILSDIRKLGGLVITR